MCVDGSTFWDIKEKQPFFREEPRNVRISLAPDDVNPFPKPIPI